MGIGAHICNSGLRKESTLKKKKTEKRKKREKKLRSFAAANEEQLTGIKLCRAKFGQEGKEVRAKTSSSKLIADIHKRPHVQIA